MRVSSYDQFNTMKFQLNQVQQNLLKLQNQNATGKQFQKLSEAPIQANQSLIIKNSLNQVDQYMKNVQDANTFLASVESNLGTVVSVLQHSREQALLASNATASTADKATYAQAINQNIEQILAIANTKFLGKQMFAGEQTQTKPFTFDGTTVTYHGNTDVPSISISPNASVVVSENGETAFRGVFDSLIRLRDDILAGNPTDIETAIADLDVALNDTIDLRSEMGVRMESMTMYKANYEAEKVTLQMKKGDVEDVDMTETIMEYVNAQMVQQGIIAVTNKMFSVSLLNYI